MRHGKFIENSGINAPNSKQVTKRKQQQTLSRTLRPIMTPKNFFQPQRDL